MFFLKLSGCLGRVKVPVEQAYLHTCFLISLLKQFTCCYSLEGSLMSTHNIPFYFSGAKVFGEDQNSR